jgi:hypothetical protein
MVKAHALDVLALDEVEDAVEIGDVVAGKREPQADFLADGLAVAKRGHRLVKRAHFATEVIVRGPHAIERDADVGEADVLDALRPLGIDPRAVGGKREAQALAGGVFGQFEELRVNRRLAAGKQQRGHFVLGQIIDHALALLPVSSPG